MAKPQPPCVKHRPPEALLLASVFDVAGHRVAERGEVDTDPVRSAGPEVPLSRRWTTPGRAAPPTADQAPPRPRRAWTRVPVWCPGAGWTTIPAGLLTTAMSSSS